MDLKRFLMARKRASATVMALQQAMSADFAVAEPADSDILAEQLAEQAAQHTDAWIETIKAMQNKATSLEELHEMILAAYPALATGDFVSLLETALTTGQLSGMSDVADDV